MSAESWSRPPRPAPGSTPEPIRLLIVDDSLVVRTILTRTLESHAGFRVVAAAGNVAQALEILAGTRVDIVLLDVQMPGRDGISALPEMIERSDGARFVMVSALCDSGAAASVQAMALGAADALLKPSAGNFGTRFADALIDRLLRLGPARRGAAQSGVAALPPRQPPKKASAAATLPLECVAIGASTGGIHALSAFFARLPRDFAAPILVTQHLPASFMPYFAGQLRDMTGRPAEVARDDMRIEPGCLIVAPGDAHLHLRRSFSGPRIRLDSTPAPSGCLPSVDPMLASLGDVYGASALALILSGMGRDGAIGARRLAELGGEILAQDAESSVVWGMPGSVVRAGIAALVASPAALADRVAAREKPGRGAADTPAWN